MCRKIDYLDSFYTYNLFSQNNTANIRFGGTTYGFSTSAFCKSFICR